MTNSPMTDNSLEMRWVETTDERGRTYMQSHWVDTSTTVAVADLVDRAA